MQENIGRLIRGCIFCCTSKPSNRKQGLYHPLPIPTHPWEIIPMEFVGCLPKTRKGHDYMFVIVNRLNKMCILMPYKNTISGKEATKFFYGNVRV